jgi:UDP-N-acetylmuramoylalanine--D-glutamate ligase
MYVLELSSYQLETTHSLQLEAGAVLNVTPDHLDRYRDLADYAAAKARIFERCATAIVNLDDEIVVRMPRPGQRCIGFSLRRPDADFRLLAHSGEEWLAEGSEPLLPVRALRLPGRHNAANALAALAVGSVCGFPREAMTDVLRRFAGLPHRAERVRDWRGIAWIDDSKGTNVGATVAAIEGLDGPLVLIAGGEGKGQDFAPLGSACRGKVRHAILIGRDAEAIAAALRKACVVSIADSMESAVAGAASIVRPGDTVLLSPACASFDMFRDYAHRGEAFASAVRGLPQ